MNNLEKIMNELSRGNKIADIIQAMMGSCDYMADFAHLSNDKKREEYYRKSAVVMFDMLRKIEDFDDIYNI